MKMKEVTEQTGLTERTVRYYMEKGLIAPHGQWQNGREYTEFDETDIARLKAVATLRELGFSVEAIRSMQAEPGLIPQIVAERRQAAESESKIANETERILSGINADDAGSIEELANRCRAYAARPKMIPNPLPLPKADEGNESGMGQRCRYVPIGIQDKWNWGAFLLPVWWGIGNRVYQAFACFIPIVGIFMSFYLGKHGNELAWKNKYWENEEHFRRVQRNWAIAGFAVTAIIIAIAITNRVATDRANKAAAERKAKLIANVENSEEYIALICGREKWKGQIGYNESGWMDPFYVDPNGYYRIESYLDVYYDVGDYGYSLPSSPHLERTLVFSNGEEYNIDATADEKLNITELKIELDKDATVRNQREIGSQRKMVAMEKDHTKAAEKCFEQCEAWRRILGTDYEYVDGPGPAEAIRNRTDENGVETDEPYIIGFAANIRANGKLYFVYHKTWKKGNGARGLEISEIDEQTRECTLIERVE